MKNNVRKTRGNRPFPDRARQSPTQSRKSQTTVNGFDNAKRSHERYIALALSAAANGDEIEIENFYQHAEHYLRLAREMEIPAGK